MRAPLAAATVIALACSVMAHAQPTDAVALLPFDAEARFDIYSQPVANAIARSLEGDSFDVVVVGPKAAVPDHVRLIVDGKIAQGPGSSVVVSLRVRNPHDGSVLDSITETASGIANIDKAAAALSAKLLPAVHERLKALAIAPAARHVETLPSRPPPSSTPPRTPMLIAIAASPRAAVEVEPLRAMLADAVAAWTREHACEPHTVDASTLVPRLAPQTVAHSGAERAIAFEVLGYEIRRFKRTVPMARARVRVRIADGQAVLFDRIVVTDSIVGAPATPPAELAARTAREVLAILHPHVKKVVPQWP